jgi:hypothetical protein
MTPLRGLLLLCRCLSATLVAVLVFGFGFAGIRVFISVLHALPLCGAAPTFLCSGKEK